MSQYLSRFYCGNREGLCNFIEPIEYDKLIDRQFDNLITEVIEQCTGDGKEKGYCCPNTPYTNQQLTNDDLDNINKTAKGKIFVKDDKGKFIPGQIPLVKVKKEDGVLKNIDICQCGGDMNEYNKCINEKCKNYRVPTKYEYCKLGNMSNQYGCYGDKQQDCKVETLNPKEGYMYSNKLRINNLFPDCYLNICNKRQIDGTLDQTANFSPETQYYALRNDIKSKYNESLSDYLLLDSSSSPSELTPSELTPAIEKGNFSIESILSE